MYAIYAYIDPSNHPNVGIYMAYMECLGYDADHCGYLETYGGGSEFVHVLLF